MFRDAEPPLDDDYVRADDERIVDVVVNCTLRQYRNAHRSVRSIDDAVDPVRNAALRNRLTFADAYNAPRNTIQICVE